MVHVAVGTMMHAKGENCERLFTPTLYQKGMFKAVYWVLSEKKENKVKYLLVLFAYVQVWGLWDAKTMKK